MAIGVDNNGHRRPKSPRPAQSAPLTAGPKHDLLPGADVDSAIRGASGDPFDPSLGFEFPPPERLS